jgi:hypothetical protein
VQKLTLRLLLPLMLAVHLAACGGSTGVTTQGPTRTPPSSTPDTVTISGSPLTTTVAGQTYRFAPSATDNLGNTVSFAIANAPAWATFDTATGVLSGSPTAAQEGVYANIVISATDGTASASLTAFSIDVTAPVVTPPDSASATVSWAAPTQNTDGSTLTNLAGFYVLYGTSAEALTTVASVDASTTAYTVKGLAPGSTYYFTVVAFNTQGQQSPQPLAVSKAL